MVDKATETAEQARERVRACTLGATRQQGAAGASGTCAGWPWTLSTPLALATPQVQSKFQEGAESAREAAAAPAGQQEARERGQGQPEGGAQPEASPQEGAPQTTSEEVQRQMRELELMDAGRA